MPLLHGGEHGQGRHNEPAILSAEMTFGKSLTL